MMSDYEDSETIHAAPDAVFSFVSDVRNLPKYLPTLHHAEPQGNDRVRVKGEAKGNPYDADGHFRVDRQSKRMEWGSDGKTRYSGWLQVQPASHGSQVTVHLQFEPRPDQAAKFAEQTGDKDTTIREGLRACLEAIRNICEGQGGKVESRAAA